MSTQKLPLPTKVTQVIEVSDFDLACYIQQCYGLTNNFEITEASNDSYKRIIVAPLQDKWDIEEAEDAVREGSCEIWSLANVMRKMCSDGFLEPGIYLVNISW
jgi:hypothetical protein